MNTKNTAAFYTNPVIEETPFFDLLDMFPEV